MVTSAPGAPEVDDGASSFHLQLVAQNKSLPVHTLPIEIFVTIINYLLPSCSPIVQGGYFEALHNFAQVCTHWATVIKGHPPFWAVANAADHPNILDQALVRSRKFPLAVQWDGRGTVSGSIPVCRSTEFFEKVRPHLYRWKSASLAFDTLDQRETFERLIPLTTAGVTLLLEDFTFLIWKKAQANQKMMKMLGGQEVPSLRNLIIANVQLSNWSPNLFSHLDTLIISSVKPPATTMLQLREILRACCHRLKSLVLEDIRFEMKTGFLSRESDQPPPPLVLQELQSLKLKNLDLEVTILILQGISAPQASSLQITAGWSDVWGLGPRIADRNLTSALKSHVLCAVATYRRRRSVSSCNLLDVPMHRKFQWQNRQIEFSIHDEYGEAEFSLQLYGVSVNEMLPWLSDDDHAATDPPPACRQSSQVIVPGDSQPQFEATIRHVTVDIDVPDIIQALKMLKSITRLYIYELDASLGAVLPCLSSPEYPSGPWLLPNLREVHLVRRRGHLFDTEIPHLVAFARARATGDPGRPPALDRLVIQDAVYDDDVWSELADIVAVGGCALSWEVEEDDSSEDE